MSGMIGLDDDIKSAEQEQDIAKHVSEVLTQQYPDHMWAVNVDLDGGIATVMNLRLSGNHGFVLHLNNILHMGRNTFNKTVRDAGGELLERYRIRRGRYDIDEYSQLHEDTAGLLIPEQ